MGDPPGVLHPPLGGAGLGQEELGLGPPGRRRPVDQLLDLGPPPVGRRNPEGLAGQDAGELDRGVRVRDGDDPVLLGGLVQAAEGGVSGPEQAPARHPLRCELGDPAVGGQLAVGISQPAVAVGQEEVRLAGEFGGELVPAAGDGREQLPRLGPRLPAHGEAAPQVVGHPPRHVPAQSPDQVIGLAEVAGVDQ